MLYALSKVCYSFCFPFSRESSPVRDGIVAGLSATLPQRVVPLTAEAVGRLQVRHTHTSTLWEGENPVITSFHFSCRHLRMVLVTMTMMMLRV